VGKCLDCISEDLAVTNDNNPDSDLRFFEAAYTTNEIVFALQEYFHRDVVSYHLFLMT
jgi:hypothetical protein